MSDFLWLLLVLYLLASLYMYRRDARLAWAMADHLAEILGVKKRSLDFDDECSDSSEEDSSDSSEEDSSEL